MLIVYDDNMAIYEIYLSVIYTSIYLCEILSHSYGYIFYVSWSLHDIQHGKKKTDISKISLNQLTFDR